MDVIIENNFENIGLIVGHLIIKNIENKKNRNKRMEKLIKSMEINIKNDPEKFVETDESRSYEYFIKSSESVIESEESGPIILVNTILRSGHLPKISRVVDCMNIVSVQTGLTISIWDMDNLNGNIVYNLSNGGEKYWPFMGEEVELLKNELAALDNDKVLCLVRYRDSKYAPVTLDTKNIVVHIQGVKGIQAEKIESALNDLEKLLLENVNGETSNKKVYTSN